MATLFQDSFARSNSLSVGNGWSEVESDNTNWRVNGSRLIMQGSAGIATNTVLHRAGSQQNSLKITGGFFWDDGAAGTHYMDILTESDGTFGKGVGVRLYHPTDGVDIYFVDDGVQKSSATFGFVDSVTYEYELIINSDYSMEVRIWTGSRPSTATASEAAFTPNASGSKWALNRTQVGNTRNIFMDDINYYSIPPVSGGAVIPNALPILGLR